MDNEEYGKFLKSKQYKGLLQDIADTQEDIDFLEGELKGSGLLKKSRK
jgi:hypothetical protein